MVKMTEEEKKASIIEYCLCGINANLDHFSSRIDLANNITKYCPATDSYYVIDIMYYLNRLDKELKDPKSCKYQQQLTIEKLLIISTKLIERSEVNGGNYYKNILELKSFISNFKFLLSLFPNISID